MAGNTLDNILQKILELNTKSSFHINNDFISILKSNYENVLTAYETKWQDASEEQIRNWSSGARKKVGHFSEDLELPEVIAVLNRAHEIIYNGERLETLQLLCLLIHARNSENHGQFCEMQPGQGKSTVVAMLTILKILLGQRNVDVICSTDEWATKLVQDFNQLYSLFSITVVANVYTENNDCNAVSSRKIEIYSADVIYSSLKTFQLDYLHDISTQSSLRYKRGFETLILDDSPDLLLEESGVVCVLSARFSSMDVLTNLYENIWKAVEIFEKELAQEMSNDIIIRYQDLSKQRLPTMEIAELYNYRCCEIQEGVNSNIEYTIAAIANLVVLATILPQHLNDFITASLENWIWNAMCAKHVVQENKHYTIEEYDETSQAETEIIQTLDNNYWQNYNFTELLPFLQLKHNIPLQPSGLTICSISSCGYMELYQSNVYAFTETYRSHAEREFIRRIYQLKYISLPRQREVEFHELPVQVIEDEHWLRAIAIDANLKVVQDTRAVIIICKTDEDCENVEKHLTLTSKIIFKSTATRLETKDVVDNNENEVATSDDELVPGTIQIVMDGFARNSCLKMSEQLILNGGLHICIGFCPTSERHKQSLFYPALTSTKGTAQLIIRQSEATNIETTHLDNNSKCTKCQNESHYGDAMTPEPDCEDATLRYAGPEVCEEIEARPENRSSVNLEQPKLELNTCKSCSEVEQVKCRNEFDGLHPDLALIVFFTKDCLPPKRPRSANEDHDKNESDICTDMDEFGLNLFDESPPQNTDNTSHPDSELLSPSTTNVAPVDTEASNEPVDTKTANAPVDTKTANAPVDTKTANTPVDTEAANAPVDTQAANEEVEEATGLRIDLQGSNAFMEVENGFDEMPPCESEETEMNSKSLTKILEYWHLELLHQNPSNHTKFSRDMNKIEDERLHSQEIFYRKVTHQNMIFLKFWNFIGQVQQSMPEGSEASNLPQAMRLLEKSWAYWIYVQNLENFNTNVPEKLDEFMRSAFASEGGTDMESVDWETKVILPVHYFCPQDAEAVKTDTKKILGLRVMERIVDNVLEYVLEEELKVVFHIGMYTKIKHYSRKISDVDLVVSSNSDEFCEALYKVYAENAEEVWIKVKEKISQPNSSIPQKINYFQRIWHASIEVNRCIAYVDALFKSAVGIISNAPVDIKHQGRDQLLECVSKSVIRTVIGPLLLMTTKPQPERLPPKAIPLVNIRDNKNNSEFMQLTKRMKESFHFSGDVSPSKLELAFMMHALKVVSDFGYLQNLTKLETSPRLEEYDLFDHRSGQRRKFTQEELRQYAGEMKSRLQESYHWHTNIQSEFGHMLGGDYPKVRMIEHWADVDSEDPSVGELIIKDSEARSGNRQRLESVVLGRADVGHSIHKHSSPSAGEDYLKKNPNVKKLTTFADNKSQYKALVSGVQLVPNRREKLPNIKGVDYEIHVDASKLQHKFQMYNLREPRTIGKHENFNWEKCDAKYITMVIGYRHKYVSSICTTTLHVQTIFPRPLPPDSLAGGEPFVIIARENPTVTIVYPGTTKYNTVFKSLELKKPRKRRHSE